MAETKPLYSTCVAVLGFICFVVGATAVGIPMWGYFDTPHGEFTFTSLLTSTAKTVGAFKKKSLLIFAF